MTRAALALGGLLALAACSHPRKVGEPAGSSPRAGEAARGSAQQGVPRRGEHPPVPESPKALLAEGEIGKIQEALEQRGYLGKDHRAGALDERTTSAIRKFQRDEQLAETGFPDRLTLQKLGLDPEDAYSKVREAPQGGVSAGSGERKGDAGGAGTPETAPDRKR